MSDTTGANLAALHTPRPLLQPWVLWVPVCLAMGINVYFHVPDEPSNQFSIIISALACVLLMGAFCLRYWLPFWGLMLAFALGMGGLGFSAAKLRTITSDWGQLRSHQSGMLLEGQVVDIIKGDDAVKAWRVLIEPSKISCRSQPDQAILTDLTGSIQLRLPPLTELSLGDSIQAEVSLHPASGPADPYGFSLRFHTYFLGISSYASLKGKLNRLPPQQQAQSWHEYWKQRLLQLRHAIADRIYTVLPNQQGAIAIALITGRREYLSAETNEAFRLSGLAHLLAISGLHFGIVVLIAFVGFRYLLALSARISLFYNTKKIAAVLAALIALAYLVLAGASLPTIRAFTMMALGMLAIVIARPPASLHAWAIAATFVLLIWPERLFSPSFQLSFSVVLALLGAYRWLWPWVYRHLLTTRHLPAATPSWFAWIVSRTQHLGSKILLYFTGILLTSVVASLVVLPLTLGQFQTASIAGIVANLAAIPLTFVVMLLGFIALLTMPFGLEEWALLPMGIGLEGLIAIANWGASLSWLYLKWPAPHPLMMASYGLGLCVLFLSQGHWRWGALPLLATAIILIAIATPPIMVLHGNQKSAFWQIAPDKWQITRAKSLESFGVSDWPKRYGLTEESITVTPKHDWPKTPAFHHWLRCDGESCILKHPHVSIALPYTLESIRHDCSQADFVISLYKGTIPSLYCNQPHQRLIPRYALKQLAPLAVWVRPRYGLMGAPKAVIQAYGWRFRTRPWDH